MSTMGNLFEFRSYFSLSAPESFEWGPTAANPMGWGALKVVFIDQWYPGEMLASLQASLWPFECSVGPVTEESRAPKPKIRKFNFEHPIDHCPIRRPLKPRNPGLNGTYSELK